MNLPSYQKGELIFINLGEVGTKQIQGHEQGKVRPCVVIKSLRKIGLLIILPLTSKKPKKIYYYHVKIGEGIGNLKTDSYVLCHQIRTVSTERVDMKIGKLPSKLTSQIQVVLLDFLQ